MNKIRICLCDDETIWYEKVREESKKNDFDVDITCCDDRTIDYDQEYDLYLLDMEFEHAKGLEIAEKIYQMHPDKFIIFFTGHESYARFGYEMDVKGFIYKPSFEYDFKKVMNALIKKIYKRRLVFKLFVDGATCKVRFSDISRVVADGHYIRVKMNNRIESVRMSLKNFTKAYDREDFVLIKIGVYANMKHITYIDERYVHFDDDSAVTIPKRRRKLVLDRFADYLDNNMA